MGDVFITTSSGRDVSLITPKPEDIDIEDIASALSKLCRFGGHSDRFYSVAEHCFLASMLDTPAVRAASKNSVRTRLATLLHDATEAYLVDIPRPLKSLLINYQAIEKRFHKVIAAALDIEDSVSEEAIKDCDNRMLVTEARELGINMNGVSWGPYKDLPSADIQLRFWTPLEARQAYMLRYDQLKELINA
jgi:hypothetical protein